MNTIKNSFNRVSGPSLLTMIVLLTTFGLVRAQESEVGPPKPVKVVNTPSEPVPVIGNINVLNTPTVRLDPDGNNVQIVTRVVAGSSGHAIEPGETFKQRIDVRSFLNVRLYARERATGGNLEVTIFTENVNVGFKVDEFTVGLNQVTRLYELAGDFIEINVFNPGSERRFLNFAVYGR